jgi:iron complex transport system ATP-binding protein
MKGFDFPQVEITRLSGNPGEALVLLSRRPLHTLSSAVVGGGFNRISTIINRHVDKNYNVQDAAGDLTAFARRHGIIGSFVGLMTAVYLDDARAATCVADDLTVATVATVGLGNRTAAGTSEPIPLTPGTINLIVLIDGQLTEAAMVNAVIAATEAKSGVLRDRMIRTDAGCIATGTSTDAVVIACTGRGRVRPYGGPATPAGWCIARSVRQAMMETLR